MYITQLQPIIHILHYMRESGDEPICPRCGDSFSDSKIRAVYIIYRGMCNSCWKRPPVNIEDNEDERLPLRS